MGYPQKLRGVISLECFAANLKALRAERGFSREDLSRASGLHTTAISKIEGANHAPRFPAIVTVAKALEVPAGRLFERIP